MGKIDYRKIYETNKDEWKALTREVQKYEALLAGQYSDSKQKIYGLGTVEECFGDRITILFDDGKEKTFDLKVCVRAGSLTLG